MRKSTEERDMYDKEERPYVEREMVTDPCRILGKFIQ